MKPEGNIKQEHILEAAIKRFAHFGINKTTLAEIAEDLSISRPLLFYYFQDKNSLIAAVAGKIINEYLEENESVAASASSVEEGLLQLVEIKRKYYKKYLLLAMQGDEVDLKKLSSALPPLYQKARERNELIVANLIKKGMEEQVIRTIDADNASKLFLDTLTAFEYCARAKNIVPGAEEIDQLFDKQKELVKMIVNGLKNNNWNN